jgi:uncharacterized Rmd1/YagE family protein
VLFPEAEAERKERREQQATEDGIQTMAERLTKGERLQIPRVTSYCIAELFKFKEITEYLRLSHGITPKQYDECLYFFYEGPVKEMKFGDPAAKMLHIPLQRSISYEGTGIYASFPNILMVDGVEDQDHPGWMDRGEVFIFDYGVLVLWNFTQYEELSFLAHMKPFAEGLLRVEDTEIEDFHFQYDLRGPFQPRIYNDMITLKSSSPMIKLTISHGLSQSVKLSLFENVMEETIEGRCSLTRRCSVAKTARAVWGGEDE